MKNPFELDIGNLSKPNDGQSSTELLSSSIEFPEEFNAKDLLDEIEVREIPVNDKAFSVWASPLAGKNIPARFGDVLEILGVPLDTAEYLENWWSMTDTMADIGFGIAPHWLLVKNRPSINEPVYLYRTTENHQQQEQYMNFSKRVYDLGIGAYVLSLGKHSSREVSSAFREIVVSWNNPNENEVAGFQANINYLSKYPPKSDFIKSHMKNATELTKLAIWKLALEFVEPLNAGKAKKQATMNAFLQIEAVTFESLRNSALFCNKSFIFLDSTFLRFKFCRFPSSIRSETTGFL